MQSRLFPTVTEQVAAHLRDELQRGAWKGTMPGIRQLAKELAVNRNTVETALNMSYL